MTQEYKENIHSIFEIAVEKSQEIEFFLSDEQKEKRREKTYEELKLLSLSIGASCGIAIGVITESIAIGLGSSLVGGILPIVLSLFENESVPTFHTDHKYRKDKSSELYIDAFYKKPNFQGTLEKEIIDICAEALQIGIVIDNNFVEKTKKKFKFAA